MLTSIAIQHGVPVEAIIKILSGSRFPPDGFIICDKGTSPVKKCSSVPDWIAQELLHAYCKPQTEFSEEKPVIQIQRTENIKNPGDNLVGIKVGGEKFDGTYPVPEDRGTLDMTEHLSPDAKENRRPGEHAS